MDYVFGIATGLACGIAAALLTAKGEAAHQGGMRQVFADKKELRAMLVVLAVCCVIGAYAVMLHGYGENAIKLIVIGSYLSSVTVNDMKRREIPDLTTIVFSLLFIAVIWWFDGPSGLLAGAIGAAVPAVLLLVAMLIKKNSVGLGDIKMVAACGLICGFPGVFFVMFRAALAILVYSLIMLIFKKLKLKSELPFAPFLLFGALI